ncbi:conjugative transfer ATPase [Shewanella xiamenensis]|uniref:Conjugative transfer ATPase n=1 Tax=Shewanella xiamenensis TaxID=332186 RepID=A0AAE4Q3V2_9GAMM|nr:conjugative transfer ATPase [Shewanella xiamenensis]MDV5393119.1 conjugative transfer ATPase [Shewanella xiamenensis]
MISNAIRSLLGQKQPLSKKDVEKLYKRDLPSFPDLLPYTGYDSTTGTFILEDGFSRAKVFTVNPLPTEGRSPKTLVGYREKMKEFIEQTFTELPLNGGQWVIQQFSFDDPRIYDLADQIEDYAAPHAKGTVYTTAYAEMMRTHLKGISRKAEGIFVDNEVTRAAWRGCYRRTKLVIYRRCTNSDMKDAEFCPAAEVNEICEQAVKTLTSGGYVLKEDTPKEFFGWLIRFFNPQPDSDDPEHYYKTYESILAREADGELPIKGALTEALIGTPPRSDNKNNCWFLDEIPTRFIRIAGCRNPPRIGQLTGEVVDGVGENQRIECTLDKVPPNSMFASTTIICPQTDFELLLKRQADNAVGDSLATARKQEELQQVAAEFGRSDSIVRNFSGIYVSGKNLTELRKNSQQVVTVLSNAGMRPIKEKADSFGLKAFMLSMPMVFNPAMDKGNIYQKPTWAQHVANLSFAYGRSEGSGNVGFSFYNRGGSPLSVDPLSKADKTSNSFGLVLGAPGSGKSATANALLAQIMAVHRPKAFIIDPGNSFGLIGDWMERHDLTVEKLSYSPSSKSTLAVFKDAAKLLVDDMAIEQAEQNASNVGDIAELISSEGDIDKLSEPDDDADRDVLGELEIIALIMITGGEKREYEQYMRADRQLLRKSIIEAAKDAREQGTITRPSHVVERLASAARGEWGGFDEKRRSAASSMAGGMATWCESGTFENAVFNSADGDGIPDADVVILDVGHFSRSGYEAQMATCLTGLLQYINNLAEKEQHSGRSILLFIDEAHLVTVNPLLAPFIIKMVKMFRKIGVNPWFITQNITDFPAEAEKLLTMIEWYIVMLASPQEVELIAKYKSLTEEQVNMITTCKKEDLKYTEGVILGKKMQEIFRAVPPSTILTLSQTDKEEKTKRAKTMREMAELGLPNTEVDAAIYLGRKLDELRGII